VRASVERDAELVKNVAEELILRGAGGRGSRDQMSETNDQDVTLTWPS
jgi:hypothetical protein